MNRRKLLLTTARGALLTAFGAVTGARAQTPIDSRAVLPIPQAKVKAPPALDARDAHAGAALRPLRAPQGAPSIVIVLLDDMGFGASSAYGGPCVMPVAERLAKKVDLYAVSYGGALLAHPASCDRPQPPFGEPGKHHRACYRISRLHFRTAGQCGDHRSGVEAQRLQHGGLRQDAPNTRVGNEWFRTIRPLADRRWLRTVLRVHRRRNQSMAADAVRGHVACGDTRRSQLSLQRGHDDPRNRLHARTKSHDSRQAILCICLLRCGPRAVPCTGIIHREVSRQIRRGLGQAA